MIAAEAWGEIIKEHYAQTGEGYHITYNNGKVVRVEGSEKVIVKLNKVNAKNKTDFFI